MATEYMRPDGTVTASGFTGGYADIDESSASDSDFAYGADNTAATLEVGTSNPSGTPSGTKTFRYRIAKTKSGVVDGGGNSVDITASVIQGTTTIATDTARTATGTWTTYTWTPDLSSVTDWTDVRLRFVTTNSGGSPANRRGGAVSWAELQVDVPAGITGTLAATESGADAAAIAGTMSGTNVGRYYVRPAGGMYIRPNGVDVYVQPSSGVFGTLAATESGSDSAAAAGTVAVSGVLAATESGADAAAIAGTMSGTNVGRYYVRPAGGMYIRPNGVDVYVQPSSGVFGTVAATESGSDSAAASGTVAVSGTLTAAETGSDVGGAVGAVLVSGTIAATEAGSDTAAATGTVAIAGILAATEAGADVAAITGTLGGDVSGTLAVVEAGPDTASLAGSVAIAGTLAASESGLDTALLSGFVSVPQPVIVLVARTDSAAIVADGRSTVCTSRDAGEAVIGVEYTGGWTGTVRSSSIVGV